MSLVGMRILIRLRNFVPYAWQDIVFNDKSKRIVIDTSRQIGKSVGAGIKSIQYAVFHDNALVIVVSRSDKQSVEFVEKIRMLLKSSTKINWDILSPKGEKESKTTIKIKNSGKKTFSRIMSLPPTESILGYSPDLVICDEAAFWEGLSEVKNSDYIFDDVVTPTVFGTGGNIIAISTPNGSQGFFYRIFLSKFWSGYEFSWHANPDKTQEDFELMCEGKTQLQIASNYLAKFVSPLNAYFTSEEIEYAIESYRIVEPKRKPTKVISCDLGKIHDSSVIEIGGLEAPTKDSKDDIVRVDSIIEKPLGTQYSAVIGELKSLWASVMPARIMLDSTGAGEGPAEFLKSDGLVVEAVKFSLQKKAEIYSVLKVLFEQKRIKIPNNKKLKDQLLSMMYEHTQLGFPKIYPPSSSHDDYVDALALLAFGLISFKRVHVSVLTQTDNLAKAATKAFSQVCDESKGGCGAYFDLIGCKKHFELGHLCPKCSSR